MVQTHHRPILRVLFGPEAQNGVSLKIPNVCFLQHFLMFFFGVGSGTSPVKAKKMLKSHKKGSAGMLWERFLIEGGKGSKK